MDRRSGDAHPASDGERRRNADLRELLDELLALVRQLTRRGHEMPPSELSYAQQRLEWLSDEIWAAATEREREGTTESDERR